MSLFYLHLSSFPRTTYGYFLSMAYSCFLWHRLIDHRCTDLFLGSHICFIHLCVFVPLSYSSDYCSFIVRSKIWEGNTSSFLLSYINLWQFCDSYLFWFCEKCPRYRNCMKYVDCFTCYGHLTILILLIYEISFHLFKSSSVLINNVL